jgi:hypothetical protein
MTSDQFKAKWMASIVLADVGADPKINTTIVLPDAETIP